MSVWDSNEDADEFMTAIVSLFRERIYKHLSENQPATTATAELMLSHPGDGEHRAVYLRFKKLEDRVLVEAFSHSELAAQADRWDDSLFKAVRATPAAPPVQTPQTTSTTVGTTETAREIYETP